MDPAERTVDMHVNSKQGTDLAVTIRPITHLQALGLCEKLGITDFHQLTSWPPNLRAIRFFVDVAGLALVSPSKEGGWTTEAMNETFAGLDDVVRIATACLEMSNLSGSPRKENRPRPRTHQPYT